MRRLFFLKVCIASLFVIAIKSTCADAQIDGTLVFSQEKIKKNISQIFIIDCKNKKLTQVTTSGRNLGPRWSPEGNRIVFASDGRSDHHNREVYVIDADGKNEKRLTYTQGGNSSNPRWGINNYEIYFTSAMRGNIRENIVDLKSNTIWTNQGESANTDLVKIKDMRDHFIELKKTSSAELEKLIKDMDMQIKNKQAMISALSNRFILLPSPDGKYQIIDYPAINKIELLDIATGKKSVLRETGASGPAWSKDGKKIAFAYSTISDHTLLIYHIENKTFETIAFPETGDQVCNGATWSKDGNHIAFACATPFGEEDDSWIYILDLQTKKSTKFVQGDSPDWY